MSAVFDAHSEEITLRLFAALVNFIEDGASRTNEGVDAMIDGLPEFFAGTMPLLRDPVNRERVKERIEELNA